MNHPTALRQPTVPIAAAKSNLLEFERRTVAPARRTGTPLAPIP
nr:hypothetical protein [Haloplanus sp. XH21]